MSYGPKAVHDLIEESNYTYPVSISRLEREYPLTNVEIDEKGNSIMLSELVLKVDAKRFDDYRDLEQKLQPVFDKESKKRRTGIVGKIKTYLFNQ